MKKLLYNQRSRCLTFMDVQKKKNNTAEPDRWIDRKIERQLDRKADKQVTQDRKADRQICEEAKYMYTYTQIYR